MRNLFFSLLRLIVLFFATVFLASFFHPLAVFSQSTQEAEIVIDAASPTFSLPKIFRPCIDLSGRGSHAQHSWPQGTAAKETIDFWQREIGFSGWYRLQYNLWEIQELAKYCETQEALLRNYEELIAKINDSGGIVILNLYSMPAGLGKILDKRSPPIDLRAYKELVKDLIRKLSCEKRYNIWYELWSAPDSEDFFLGRRQEYLAMYRQVAEAIQELEKETKLQIPLGGPGISAWFQNVDGNTVVSPERSLIYELIKYCYHNRLPLDFISWHSYSSDPKADQELTIYRKSAVNLVREWLSYFHFNYNLPLIISEWNFDAGSNISAERHGKSYIAASYIPARLKNMYEAGIDYSIFYCLEDFKDNKDGVARNVGVFWYEGKKDSYKVGQKAIYSVFKMLSLLGKQLFPASLKQSDDFVTVLATKDKEGMVLIISSYVDPNIGLNYISRNISILSDGERRILLSLLKNKKLELVLSEKLDFSGLRLTWRLKSLLKKAIELQLKSKQFREQGRKIKLSIKNLKDNYIYKRFTMDSSCSLDCEWKPSEEKEVNEVSFQESIFLSAYSTHCIIFKKKTKEIETVTLGKEGIADQVLSASQANDSIKTNSTEERQRKN